MTTWTITGTSTYTGPVGVDVIDFNTGGSTAGYIDTGRIATFSVGGRGTFLDLAILGSPSFDSLYVRMNGATSVNLSAVSFGEGWTAADRLTISGDPISQRIVGSNGDDLIGGRGGNDSVQGGGGTDILSIYDYSTSRAYSSAGPGVITDGQSNTVTFAGIEALQLGLGSGNDSIMGLSGDDWMQGSGGNDTLDGQGGRNVLYGGVGNDILEGQAGNDRLFGEGGSDQIYGGSGDDFLYVADALDRLYEYEGGGTDTVLSTVSINLASIGGQSAGEIENLTLQGGDINGTGNALDNVILDSSGANILRGGLGADRIDVTGDAAADTLVFRSASESTGKGRDTVTGFDAAGEDKLDIRVAGNVDVDAIALRTGFALSEASFDADLAKALNKSFDAGGGVQAFLFDPVGGTLDRADQRFVVVDLNDDGAYTAGVDLVVQFSGLTGTLDFNDLIRF